MRSRFNNAKKLSAQELSCQLPEFADLHHAPTAAQRLASQNRLGLQISH